jgi:hypothetical protein
MATGFIFMGYDWWLQLGMDWHGTAVPERRQRLSRRAIAEPVATGTRPPIKNDNVNGFSIIIS